MAGSIEVEVADALVDALNGATFSESFTATRSYRPEHKLADLATLTVTVVPRSTVERRINRAKVELDAVVDVGIQQRCGMDSGSLDTVSALKREVMDWLNANPTLASIPATLIEIANDPNVAAEHLEGFRLFTSIITATYRTARGN